MSAPTLINPVERIRVGGNYTFEHRGFTVPEELRAKLETYHPKTHLGQMLREALKYVPDINLVAQLIDELTSTTFVTSSLALKVIRGPRSLFGEPGAVENHGIVSHRVVTTAGVNFIVDAFQNSVELEIMKYHGLGTGSTSEVSGDTALVTELTTEYTGNVRATGTTAEGASANIFQTVATNTLDGTPGAALREHGIFSASSSGTLLDRSVYSAITLSSGDGLQSTYELTLTAGS